MWKKWAKYLESDFRAKSGTNLWYAFDGRLFRGLEIRGSPKKSQLQNIL